MKYYETDEIVAKNIIIRILSVVNYNKLNSIIAIIQINLRIVMCCGCCLSLASKIWDIMVHAALWLKRAG